MTAQTIIDAEEIIAASLEATADYHGIDPDLLVAFVEMEGFNDLEEAVDRFQDQYAGTYDSLTDWAEDILEETGGLAEIPERLRYYFDFEKYARDCELGGDVYTISTNQGTAVFWNR